MHGICAGLEGLAGLLSVLSELHACPRTREGAELVSQVPLVPHGSVILGDID